MNLLKNQLLQNNIQIIRYSNQTEYFSDSPIGSNLFVGQRLAGQQLCLSLPLVFGNGQGSWCKTCCFPAWREWSSSRLETAAQPGSSEMEEPQENTKQFSQLEKPLPQVFLTHLFQDMSDNWSAICCWSDVFIWCMVSLSSYNTYSKELKKKWSGILYSIFYLKQMYYLVYV